MKTLKVICLLILIFCSCKKDQAVVENKNVTVQAVVWNEKNQGRPYEGDWWKPGIIFSKGINANGRAVIGWYSTVSGKHYNDTILWNVTIANNGFFHFYSQYGSRPDSITLKSFEAYSGNYIYTKLN